MSDIISIRGEKVTVDDCETVISVPEIAVSEPGHIKTYSRQESGNAKHEFHALAQMVYFQFQDEELEIIKIDSPLTISDGAERTELRDGLVLCRDRVGELQVLAIAGKNTKKLLEAAYRYCTRWVRLDI
ncbi:MAG: hypothetical protein KJ630_23435 [Proteobacteria bacterium]|nr:hypothetical protein [Pseudomonadota bacterium]